MSTIHPNNLEEAIRQSGEGWLIDWFAPKEKAMEHLAHAINAVNLRAQERLGGNAPDLSETAIVREFQLNPQRVRGFFQALGGSRTPDMLLMVWRIIQGMEIKDIHMDYRRQRIFAIRVILESQYGDPDEIYESSQINDFAIFRHIGIIEISGKPVFDGFYPLNVRGAESHRT